MRVGFEGVLALIIDCSQREYLDTCMLDLGTDKFFFRRVYVANVANLPVEYMHINVPILDSWYATCNGSRGVVGYGYGCLGDYPT